MFNQLKIILITLLSCNEALRGQFKLRKKLRQQLIPENEYPELFHDQILNHFDATDQR